eukprot:6390145-Prymnesium_polylepis.1
MASVGRFGVSVMGWARAAPLHLRPRAGGGRQTHGAAEGDGGGVGGAQCAAAGDTGCAEQPARH